MPGFLRRSLTFAIPAGLLIATALTLYTRGAMSLGITEAQLRTGSTIILAIVGIWVLAVLARPLNRFKVLVVGGMFVTLSVLFTVPLAGEFFQLVDPGEEAAYLIAGITIVTILAIEVVRIVHRQILARGSAREEASTSARRPDRDEHAQLDE